MSLIFRCRFCVIRGAAVLLSISTLVPCVTYQPPVHPAPAMPDHQSLPVSLTYTPDQSAQPVIGAEAIHVDVIVKDLRQDKSNLGDAGTVIRTIPVVTGDDLLQLLKSAVQSELTDRDFRLGVGGALVLLDLEALDVGEHTSLAPFSPIVDLIHGNKSNVRAIAIIGTQVKHADGTVLYSKIINGKVEFAIGNGETGSSASERALDYALDNVVRNLFADPEFIKALLATAKPAKLLSSTPHSGASPAHH